MLRQHPGPNCVCRNIGDQLGEEICDCSYGNHGRAFDPVAVMSKNVDDLAPAYTDERNFQHEEDGGNALSIGRQEFALRE